MRKRKERWRVVTFSSLVVTASLFGGLLSVQAVMASLHSGSEPRIPLDLPSGGLVAGEEEEEAPEVINFYGNFYEGDAFFWCLDRSGSMLILARLEILKQEISRAVNSLSDQAEFSLVAFSSNTTAWSSSPRLATLDHKAAATAWVNNLVAHGNTCVGSAAVEALGIARRSRLKHRQLIVVSDGLPYCGGQLTASEDLTNITNANYERLPIHTLFLGDDSEGRHFMQNLAAANGGTFAEVRSP